MYTSNYFSFPVHSIQLKGRKSEKLELCVYIFPAKIGVKIIFNLIADYHSVFLWMNHAGL